MLSPLSGPVLERLARDATRTAHPAGAVVIREGDRGDRFHVVVAGTLEVTVGGHPARLLGPGDSFGEIALIRDLTRSATVSARSEVILLGIDRDPFLEALTGQPRSRRIATTLVDDRLAADVTRA
jgi:CRP-like cAMP-binding protein